MALHPETNKPQFLHELKEGIQAIAKKYPDNLIFVCNHGTRKPHKAKEIATFRNADYKKAKKGSKKMAGGPLQKCHLFFVEQEKENE